MNLSIVLSTKNFAEASKIDINNDFLFIIGDHKVSCNRFVAAFLSHTVCNSLISDPTFNSFNITPDSNENVRQKQKYCNYIKQALETLISGKNIDINLEELQKFNEDLTKITKQSKLSDISDTKIPSLFYLFKTLENEELKDQLYTQLFSFLSSKINNKDKDPKKITKEEIESKISQLQKIDTFFNFFESNKSKENLLICIKKYLKQDYVQIIDDIASHFYLLEETFFNEINGFIVDSILSSEKLQIKSEDSLLQMILNRRKYILSNIQYDDENENHFFIEKVQFEYLTEKSIEKFLNEIQFNEIDERIWDGIKKRLMLPVKMIPSNNKRCNSNYSDQFKYDDQNPFNGIFRYLTKKTNGNIHTNKMIEISTSHLCCGKLETLVDFDNPKAFTHVCKNPNPRWLQIDLKSGKAHISSYLIKSADKSVYSPINALKSWQIEISQDGNNWQMIDKQENVSELNGENNMKLFKVSANREPFRFIRIITDQESWTNKNNGFTIRSFELFGQIIE